MSYTYDQRKRPRGQEPAPEPAAPGPDFRALMTGAAKPTAAQKGRPIDLDAAMKARMEHAFGDLSAVRLYESPAVGRAGAEAMAMGNEIAFAPGMADFSSRSGQERLGHELSHVMSRRTGAVRGEGFLANPSLEAKADREGAMAAAGEQVYTGPVTSALSAASPAPSVAGPMQAKRRDADARGVKEMQQQGATRNETYATPDYNGYYDLPGEEWEEKVHRPGFSRLWGKKDQKYKVRRDLELLEAPPLGPESGLLTTDLSKIDHSKIGTIDFRADAVNQSNVYRPPEADEAQARVRARLEEKYGKGSISGTLSRPANPGEEKGVDINGLMTARMFSNLFSDRGRGFEMGEDKIYDLMDKLMAPHKKGMNEQEQTEANSRFDEGMQEYKGILMGDLKHLENTYGSMVTQMHPEDILPQLPPGAFGQGDSSLQDTTQMVQMGGKYFDPQNEEDQKFIDLTNYYNGVGMVIQQYKMAAHSNYAGGITAEQAINSGPYLNQAMALENKIGGPKMNEEQQQDYLASVKNRKNKSYMKGRLFGRFK